MDKYYANSNNLKDIISKYGVAIIPNILNDEECLNMINNMWNYLEFITSEWDVPINRNKYDTWHLIKYLTYYSSIFQFWNIGHSQMCWDVRQNPKIVEIFAKFWDVQPEQLLASFDGGSFIFPPEITDFYWDNDNQPWFHTDQSYLDSSFQNLQSWVTAYDVDENDATLVFLEGSHNYHSEFAIKFKITNLAKFYKLNEEELNDYLTHFEIKKISCPKGSLVIWDSRTIHYGSGPIKNRNKENIRCISYLCYAPKSLIDKENLINKKIAFKKLYTTSHDPCNIRYKPNKVNQPVFDENIEFNLDLVKKIKKPELTELGISLSGINYFI
jgi:hypothetical protein